MMGVKSHGGGARTMTRANLPLGYARLGRNDALLCRTGQFHFTVWCNSDQIIDDVLVLR